jgi:uncharacterized protein YidB (DUF937 family)
MDMSTILQFGASIIQQNSDEATTGISSDKLSAALSSLLGREGGNPDLGTLLSKMQSGGMGDLLSSWSGKGSNAPINGISDGTARFG